ncbi:SpoIIE family protein phosphatase [Thermobifida halotolerans]|uniref:SpoIIE family protein phosphatase n=3 Tax=Thermobifida halotolerans TaxID=483545 RepID=UPI001FB33F61|nr:SpoIIE family protein phosphatase [Thermobifida halotolerans]
MRVDKAAEQNATAVGGEVRLGGLALEALGRAPVGIAVVRGPDHRLIYTNAVYQEIFGPRPLGRPFPATFGDLAQSGYALLLDRVMTTGEPIVLSESPVTVDYPGSGRHERYFNLSLFPVSLEDGEHAVMAMLLEVTDRINAEQRDLAFQRYASLVRAGGPIEWSASAVDGSVELSQGWEKVTGQRPEEYRGYGWLDAVAPDDRPALVLAWSQAVEQVPDLFEHTFRVRQRDGTYRHFRTRAVPVRQNGVVVEWTGTCTDVEQQWREQRRRDLFARASAATSEATRIDKMFDALAHAIVPELADACSIYLVPDSVTHPLGPRFISERIAWAVRPDLPNLPSHRRERFAAYDAFARSVQQRRPLHRAFPAGQPPSDLLPANTVRWLRETRANSFVVLPLVVEGAAVAVLTAAVCGEREPIDQDDVDLLTDILDHIRPAVDTVAEFQRTQRVALALQHSLLGEPPTVPGMSIVGRYQPSPAASHVGGDWYDAFTVDDSVMLAIGDIAGHDLTAAIAMSQLRNMLRAFAVDRPRSPGEVLCRLDSAVEKSGEYEGTATCVLARVEPTGDGHWQVNYSVAGHPPPLLVSSDGDVRFLDRAHAPLLGLAANRPRSSAVESLPPGSTLLLYTDGLVEQPRESLDHGLERLARHSAPLAREPLHEFCDRLLTQLPTAGSDDIALIALRLSA